jgi:hypothetical protein
MIKGLAELPPEHPQRNTPLEGAWHRAWILVTHEVTDPIEKIEEIRLRRLAGERTPTPWRQVKGWKIAGCTYNQLSLHWTHNIEWSFVPTRKSA